MTLEGGPHVKFVTLEQELLPDGTILQVPVVHTGIVLSDLQPGYDEGKWRELIGHIQTWQRLNNNRKVLLRNP